MEAKDYYKILDLPPSATLPEIKKSYRKLALQYHPDKNAGNPYYAVIFSDIQEAYEVLCNPSKKEYYLQQRWYYHSIGKRKQPAIITPAAVLKQVLDLEKYIYRLDHFRMDKEGLYNYILSIIPDTVIEKLNTFHDLETNEKIVQVLLACSKPLDLSFIYLLQKQITKIHISDSATAEINQYIVKRKKTHKNERFRIWIILLLVILICLLIFSQS